jgi:uncharacterized membrane protein (DUF485 family)
MSAPHAEGPAQPETLHTYREVQESQEFVELRRRFRAFVFPMTGLFLLWYFAYVLLSTYAPDFMGTRVADSNITVGLLLGLGQFVSTFAITMTYASWANKRQDPIAEHLRQRIEGADL